MTDDKQLDHLISVLYETALDSSRWQEAVGLCGHYAGGIDAHMVTLDKKRNIPIASVLASTNVSIEGDDDYVNHYMAIDPRFPLISNPHSKWQYCHHVNSQNFVDRSEFYQDFLIPYGVRYAMLGRIDNSEFEDTFLAVLRAVGQQPFDEAEQFLSQRFCGHLQRALRLQRHTQNLQTKAELGARAIDALALSMLIVDANGVILHLNASAEQLLNSPGSGLTSKQGYLSAFDPTHKNKLAALISEATAYPSVGGAMFLSGNQTRQVFVTPLPAASPFAQDWQRPLALVLVLESGTNLSALQLQSTLYGLSPAELRVAAALLAGKSPEEYALEAEVTMNTVRTQLKNLFQKTGTHRQSELVAVLGKAPPLHN